MRGKSSPSAEASPSGSAACLSVCETCVCVVFRERSCKVKNLRMLRDDSHGRSFLPPRSACGGRKDARVGEKLMWAAPLHVGPSHAAAAHARRYHSDAKVGGRVGAGGRFVKCLFENKDCLAADRLIDLSSLESICLFGSRPSQCCT